MNKYDMIAIFSIMFVVCGALVVSFWIGNPTVEEVNGNSTEGVTYYLGDEIHYSYPQRFYFHGIILPFSSRTPDLLIGHTWNEGGTANIHVQISRGEQFRILDQSFKVVDWGSSWITLERV